MNAYEFLKRLREGGAIVSSNDLSADDIAAAQAEDRMYVDADHFGYVYVPIEGAEDE